MNDVFDGILVQKLFHLSQSQSKYCKSRLVCMLPAPIILSSYFSLRSASGSRARAALSLSPAIIPTDVILAITSVVSRIGCIVSRIDSNMASSPSWHRSMKNLENVDRFSVSCSTAPISPYLCPQKLIYWCVNYWPVIKHLIFILECGTRSSTSHSIFILMRFMYVVAFKCFLCSVVEQSVFNFTLLQLLTARCVGDQCQR